MIYLRLLCLFLFLLFSYTNGEIDKEEEREDLYQILGVTRTADKEDIKKAYARLAKKWHPDKNKSPNASDMMSKINKAYKILYNDSKRRRYDIMGEESEDDPYIRKDTRNYATPTDTVTSIQFIDHIVPHSHIRPYLVYYFHDFCQPCLDWTEKWEDLRKDFTKLGLGTASVHVIISTQATLFSRVQLNKVPKIGLLIKGVVHLYTGQNVALDEIKEFIDPLIPSLIQEVFSVSLPAANLSRVRDNKPLVILVSSTDKPSLIYKLVALDLSKYCNFYFLSSSAHSSNDLLHSWGIELHSKQLLVYKESTVPAVVLESLESKDVIRTTIQSNKFLTLPRISSQHVFDTICPYSALLRRTCIILITQSVSEYTDELTGTFRDLADKWKREDMGVAYIDINRQSSFSDKFYSSIEMSTKTCSNGFISRSVLVVQRYKVSNAYYAWYHGYCGETKDEMKLKELSKLKDRALGKPILLEPFDDESFTWMSHIVDSLPRYWEKLLSIFFLPFPLLLLSCYLFYNKDPQTVQQHQPRTPLHHQRQHQPPPPPPRRREEERRREEQSQVQNDGEQNREQEETPVVVRRKVPRNTTKGQTEIKESTQERKGKIAAANETPQDNHLELVQSCEGQQSEGQQSEGQSSVRRTFNSASDNNNETVDSTAINNDDSPQPSTKDKE